MSDQIITWVASALFIAGSLLTLVTAIGVVRFPDLLARMHASTKPQTLGTALLMIGLALSLQSLQVAWKVALVILFQLITSPVSAHMLSRAGVRTGKVASDLLVVDELSDDRAHGEPGPRN